MAKPLSFRFDDNFVTNLRTWSFVTGIEQKQLIEEAFGEYAEARPEIKEKVMNIILELSKE